MKDKKILKELRNGPMKSMKDDEYAMIEKEVDEKGIAGLKGYAKSMIEKAMREMAYSMKDTMKKHQEHDQSSHGNWAGDSMGGGAKPPTTPEAWGKEEDELAAKFEREEDMTTSDAQGLAMSEMQRKYGTSREKLFAPKKIAEAVPKKVSGFSGAGKQGEVTTTPRVLDRLFGKGETVLGDEFERKVTEEWVFEMTNPYTGKKFKASIYDWMRYDEMGLSADEGQKLAPMDRAKSGRFSIATSSREDAKAVEDFIAATATMKKAISVKSGDMVSWNSSGGTAQGKVVRVISSGKINVPDSSFSIEGSEDDPAALIQLYRDGKPTETKVGHKVSTLKKK
jgi:hypothetical protein